MQRITSVIRGSFRPTRFRCICEKRRFQIPALDAWSATNIPNYLLKNNDWVMVLWCWNTVVYTYSLVGIFT